MEQSTLHIVNVTTGEQLLWCDVPVTPEQHRTAEDGNTDNDKSSKSKFCEDVTISPELERKYDHVFTFLDVASRHCYELFGKHMRQQQQQQQQQYQQQQQKEKINLQEHCSQNNKTNNVANSKNAFHFTSNSHELSSSSPFALHQLKSVCTTVESSPCANSSAWSECDQAESSHVDGDDEDINSEHVCNAQTSYSNDANVNNNILHNNNHIMEKSSIYEEDGMNKMTEFDIYGDDDDDNDDANDNIDKLSEDNASVSSSSSLTTSSASSSSEMAKKKSKNEE